MEELYFENYDELVCDICDEYDAMCEELCSLEADVMIVAKYENARNIIAGLVRLGHDIKYIELTDEMWDGYDREFYITLTDEGIFCEKGYDEDNECYLNDEPKVLYIMDDCNSKILQCISTNCAYSVTLEEEKWFGDFEDEYEFDDEEECDGDCGNCKYNKYEDDESEEDDLKGFTISGSDEHSSWSRSFYSSDKDLVRTILNLWS